MVFDSFSGFGLLLLSLIGVCLVIDYVTVGFDMIRIESSVRLIRDYALTGDSDSMEIMNLNFLWIEVNVELL